MISVFESAFNISLANEGGYVLSTLEGDAGGPTFAGIAFNMHPLWSGWTLVNQGDRNSLALIGLVKDFYRNEFWVPLNCDQMPSKIAAQVFDMAINAGQIPAAKALQAAAGVKIDGSIGAKTMAAVRVSDPIKLVVLFNIERSAYYRGRSNWSKFGNGWIARVERMLRVGLA